MIFFLSLTIPGACVRASSLSDYNFFVVLTLGASFVIAVSLCNFSFVRSFVRFVFFFSLWFLFIVAFFFLDELLLRVASSALNILFSFCVVLFGCVATCYILVR